MQETPHAWSWPIRCVKRWVGVGNPHRKANAPSGSIFHTEFEATYRGQLDIIRDLPPWSAYAWLGDNVGAIYVSRKGLSKFREVNEKLLELFTLKQEAKLRAHHSYICSEENPMDRASRLALEYAVIAPPCTEHPGDMCNEFLAWIRQQSQNPTEGEN